MNKGELSPEREQNMRDICDRVIEVLKIKNPKYGESWKSHGGFSAFFNIQRKWSRIETLAAKFNFDIFAAIDATADEPDGMLEAMSDLVGYLLLALDDRAVVSVDSSRRDHLEYLALKNAPRECPWNEATCDNADCPVHGPHNIVRRGG